MPQSPEPDPSGGTHGSLGAGSYQLPSLTPEVARGIKLLRRDIGNLLFHFTRSASEPIAYEYASHRMERDGSARNVLEKILRDSGLKGTSTYIRSTEPCVCFTEAPLHEFASLFRLNELAASQHERPRYEPYGVAVNKEWLFAHGGRPVIYDSPGVFDDIPSSLRYRHVPYEPAQGIDHTWEREWRIRTEWLKLDPLKTLVVVPSAAEAAEIVYGFSDWEDDTQYTVGGPVPTWLAVSLDIFGFDPST